MDNLGALGTAIGDVVFPTFKAYAPLLGKNANNIRSTTRQTFSYGSHPRQSLDLYTPSNKATGELKNSVFIFLYGGGLVRGDKINPAFAEGLVYSNVGHFFAETLGIPTVILDYRLISHGAVFPSGGEDLALTIDWVEQNLHEDQSKPLDLFVMGNSAGGLHLSTFLLASDFASKRQHLTEKSDSGVKLRSAILLAVPFHFKQADASRKEALDAYYGQNIEALCPLGLLKTGIQTGSITDLTDIAVLQLTATLDPEDEIVIPGRDFGDEWRTSELISGQLTSVIIEGHNHISPVLGIGTGVEQEELWAQRVVSFVKQSARSQ